MVRNADYNILEASCRAMECSVKATRAKLKRGLTNLATIASTAPLIGLLGTVLGIVNSFKGVGFPLEMARRLEAQGVAEALASAAVGILIAVPSLWAYNHFIDRVEDFHSESRNAMLEILTYLSIRSGAKRKIC